MQHNIDSKRGLLQCQGRLFTIPNCGTVSAPVVCRCACTQVFNNMTLLSSAAVCAPGYGGADVNNCEDCADATTPGYGPEFRSDTACISCPTQNVGFSFFYKETLIPYMSAPVVRSKATSPADCVSRYAQIESGLWYLAGASTANAATTLANCVTACNGDANCMFINFQYTATSVANPATDTTGTCTLATSGDTGTGWVTSAASIWRNLQHTQIAFLVALIRTRTLPAAKPDNQASMRSSYLLIHLGVLDHAPPPTMTPNTCCM